VSKLSRRELLRLTGGIAVLAQTPRVTALSRSTAETIAGGPSGAVRVFKLDPSRTAGEISALLFGHNLEHTRRAVWQGLSAQMLANRKFAGASSTDRKAATADQGFIGRLRTQGEPGLDGVAAHWYGIGNSWTNFLVDDEIAYAGRTAQRLDITEKERWGGVGQQSLDLLAGTRYQIRLTLRTHFAMKARLRVCDASSRKTYCQEDTSWSGNEWHSWITEFTAVKSDPAAKLEITFEGLGTAWLGAASLLPANRFRGLRNDVIAALKEISVPILRWPGGNFTRDWKWKDGLLPVDRRPPVMLKNHEVLPFTDNYDCQEIGIDDFLALCENLGALPSLTLNITDDLQNACDLVEYCNGPADSGWGRTRAERGHPAPYNVRFWSLGNENFGPWMGPAYFPPEEYARQVERFAQALRKIDPGIDLIGSGAAEGYCQKMVAVAGKDLQLVSAHDYFPTPEADSVTSLADLEMGRKPTLALRKVLKEIRSEIDQGLPAVARRLPIALDEWNIWHWWFVSPFEHEWHSGPLNGMYAASALNLFSREGQSLGLHSAMFFQPINEGCIAVQPHTVNLTASGQVFRLFRAHQGNALIETAFPRTDEDLDLCASLDRARSRLVVTLLNRSATQHHAARLELARTLPSTVEARLLRPKDLQDPDSLFEEAELEVNRERDVLSLELPAYSIARIEIGFDAR
jgi:alpha-L-arabinofuranosidase